MAKTKEAVYLGVKDWGAEGTDIGHAAAFRYRFLVNGMEECFRIGQDPPGFPLQNALKVGAPYEIIAEEGMLRSARELASPAVSPYHPPVSGVPGLRTVKNFLLTALEPVGTTLYVFGGGWDWQDTGTSLQARSLGVSADWVRFFQNQDAGYTYKDRDNQEENRDPVHSYYPFGGFNQYSYAGLDCSGYVGWAVYNTLNRESGKAGCVGGANRMAKRFAQEGLGAWTRDENLAAALRPGDIVSMEGHVWISLGACGDGSAVILHSTPSLSRQGQPGGGVQIGAVGEDTDCEAYRLADRYMTACFPAWHARYETALKSPALYFALKLEENGRFSWGPDAVPDPDGIGNMTPAQALALLFHQA
ncbi:MAG: hypothetical protein IK099_05160 [Clostridia bacterium]|nr:hypothetical protein [Clostridia bacterium]